MTGPCGGFLESDESESKVQGMKKDSDSNSSYDYSGSHTLIKRRSHQYRVMATTRAGAEQRPGLEEKVEHE